MDELAGLLNRRAFNLILNREIARADRDDSHHFAVLMFDVAGLKGINDRYGHRAGSRLLQAVAAGRIRSAVHNASIEFQGEHIHTSVSIGIASYPESVSQAADVLDKVDQALYDSKRSGRNRGSYYDSEPETVAAIA